MSNYRNERVVLTESANVLGLENDLYLTPNPYGRSVEFVMYAENPIPGRIYIEDLERRFFTCIGLFEPVYYLHDIYQDIFTKKQKEALNRFLNEGIFEFDKGHKPSKWDHLVSQWESAVGDNNLKVPSHSSTKPNYLLLPDSIGE